MLKNASTPLSEDLHVNLKALSGLLGHPLDLQTQTYGADQSLGIVYLESLTNESDLKTHLLQPLLGLTTQQNCSVDTIAALLPVTGLRRRTDLETAAYDLFQGRAMVFFEHETEALSFAFPGWAKHEVQEPRMELTIRGPREGFTETLLENIGLIRRWIADPRLRVDALTLGRRTQTHLAVMYLQDIAQPLIIKEVKKRLGAIDIDGVIDSGYLEQLISDRRTAFFQLTQATERTDRVTAGLLEGRVAILVDKSPSVILVPVTINELYQSPEDYYINFGLASFNRLIRFSGNILAVGLPGLYVAFASVNPELLPTPIALTLAISRSHAPFPLPVEVFLMEVVLGFFYEAALRLPAALSQTVGITAGVVFGLAGVFSGFISPVTLIMVSVTAVASFTGPNQTTAVVWRILKYLFLLAASLLGFFGLTIIGVVTLGHLAELKSFGVSYLAPWAPLQWPELVDAPLRLPFWTRWTRPRTYRPQNQLRSGGTKREDEEDD